MVYKQTYRNAWLQAVEQYLVDTTALPGEQLALPDGLPEPPYNRLVRALPFQLHYYADPAGGSIRPTYTRLAKVNRCSVDTVRRAMQTLEQAGLITRHGPAYRGRAQSWRMATPAWLTTGKGGKPVHPFTAERVAGDTGKGGKPVLPHHSPKGDGPYVTDDAPPGARVTETDNQTHVIPLQRAQALDAGCPNCGSSKGKACRGLRPGRFHPERVATAS